MVPLMARMAAMAALFMAACAVLSGESKAQVETENLELTVRGDWVFRTEPYRSGFCVMSGRMSVFAPRVDEDKDGCALTAVEICGDEKSIVEQSCRVSAREGRVYVDSEIINMLQTKPSSTGYAPDNFVFVDVTSTRLDGYLVSAVSAPVVFSRPDGGLS